MNKLVPLIAIALLLLVVVIVVPNVYAKAQTKAMQNLQTIITGNSTDYHIRSFTINGEVENNSTKLVNYAQVLGTFYDTEGKIIGSDFTFTTDIFPGSKTPFHVTLMNISRPLSDINNGNYTMVAIPQLWKDAPKPVQAPAVGQVPFQPHAPVDPKCENCGKY